MIFPFLGCWVCYWKSHSLCQTWTKEFMRGKKPKNILLHLPLSIHKMRKMDWWALCRAISARLSITLDMSWRVKPISRKSTRWNNVLQAQCPGGGLMVDMENQSNLPVLAVLAGIYFYLPYMVPGVILSQVFPATTAWSGIAGDNNSTQGWRGVPRPMEEPWIWKNLWLLWAVFLPYSSQARVIGKMIPGACGVLKIGNVQQQVS